MELSGGEKLERALADIGRRLSSRPTLEVGFLSGATYPDGTSVALVASVQEFGSASRGIPPRPYFRSMIARNGPAWPGQLAETLKRSDYDAEKALNIMGAVIAGELQQSIRDTNDPPLAPATVKAKGFAKPLIDTGHMLNSVSWRVA